LFVTSLQFAHSLTKLLRPVNSFLCHAKLRPFAIIESSYHLLCNYSEVEASS